MSQKTSNDNSNTANQPDYLLPVLIVSCIVVGIGLIAVLTYLIKIKNKKKSQGEINRMRSIFKKSYVEYKRDVSSFSLKISNLNSDLNVSNSFAGGTSQKNSFSSKNPKIINFKKLNLVPNEVKISSNKIEIETLNAVNSSQRNHENSFPIKKPSNAYDKASLFKTNVIKVVSKNKEVI
jgi:hypothetical protein